MQLITALQNKEHLCAHLKQMNASEHRCYDTEVNTTVVVK